jgi:glycosyltransferase involved in cell wall biosynthesis
VSDRAEVLFVSPVTPATGGNGLAMRAGLFLEGIARSRSVDVLVVPVFGAPVNAGPLVTEHARSFGLLELPLADDPVARMRSLLATPRRRERARALEPLPPNCWWASAPAAEEVARRAEGVRAVHVMRTYLSPAVDALLDAPARPWLSLDVDDLEPGRLASHYLPLFDAVIAGSERDAAELTADQALRRVEVVPNAVRPPLTVEESKRIHDLIFVGNLSYAPNVEAARWLCERVLPLLDGVSIALVGSRPDPAVFELAELPGVTVAADVADVAPWYAGSAIAVVPLHSGGGTATKTLEALAHGRPVVATPRGAAALDSAGARDVALVAEAPEAFAAACRRLLDSPGEAAQRAASGRELVARHASVDAVAPRVDALFANMLAP